MENISQNQIEQEPEQKTTVEKKPKKESRADKINRFVQDSEQFNKETQRNVEVLPNVHTVVVFFEDWYLDWDELYHEAKVVRKLNDTDAIKYADKHYRVKKSVRDS